MLLFLFGFLAGSLTAALAAYTLMALLDPYGDDEAADAFLETFGGPHK